MAKSKKAVVIEKKHKVQKAPKIKVVPNKVQKKAKVSEVKKVVPKVKKAQPKIVKPNKVVKVKPKVEKVPKVKKVQPKIVQPKVKEVQAKSEKVKPKVEVEQSFKAPDFQPLPLIPIKLTDAVMQNIPFEIKVENEQPLKVSEMTIIEIMHQKNISREAAISFIKANQRK